MFNTGWVFVTLLFSPVLSVTTKWVSKIQGWFIFAQFLRMCKTLCINRSVCVYNCFSIAENSPVERRSLRARREVSARRSRWSWPKMARILSSRLRQPKRILNCRVLFTPRRLRVSFIYLRSTALAKYSESAYKKTLHYAEIRLLMYAILVVRDLLRLSGHKYWRIKWDPLWSSCSPCNFLDSDAYHDTYHYI